MTARRILPVLLLAALALSPALRGRFLLDDVRLLLSGLPPPKASAWLNPVGSRPLPRMILEAERRLWGDAPFGYHLDSLLLHLGNTALLALGVLRIWPGGIAPASAAALAFGLHPLSASAACYVAERTHLLVAAGALGTLHALLSRRPALAWAAWLLAFCSKETAVALPLCLLPLSGVIPRPEARAAVRAWALRASLAALALGAAGLWIHAGLPAGGLGGDRPSRLAYLLTAPGAVLRYLGAWALPFRIPLDADLPLASPGTAAAGAALLGLLLVLSRRAGPWAAAAFPAALLALLPETSFLPLQDPLAFHRMYVPGLFLALGVAPLLAARPALRAAWVAAALALSFHDAGLWRSPLLRSAEDLRDAPRKLRLHAALAQGHLARFRDGAPGRPLADAERVLRRSLRISERAEQRRDLALVLHEGGRPAEALAEARRSLALEPGRPDALILEGYALWNLGRRDEAERSLEAARRAYLARRGVLYSAP